MAMAAMNYEAMPTGGLFAVLKGKPQLTVKDFTLLA